MKKEKLIENLLGSFQVPELKSEIEIWSSLNDRIDLETKVVSIKKRSILTRLVPFAAAASIAIAVVLFFPSSNSLSFKNDSKDVLIKNFPDGSVVTLSPQSEVSFVENDESREVILDGEAFFQVEKGIPFFVKTDNGSVSVLGTSFYVTDREDLIDVKCFTGKVKVRTGDNDFVLVKGEGVSNLVAEKYNHSSVKKYQQDKLSFDNIALSVVLEDLRINSGVTIVNLSNSNPFVSLQLEDENNLEMVSILSTISNLNYRQVGEATFELY